MRRFDGKRRRALRLAWLWLVVSCCIAVCTIASDARADDVADEADTQFNLGTEQYQEGNYEVALSHFLASNRLAKNKNVLFNIARCYEQLRRFPEAHRYYTRALEVETNQNAVTRSTAPSRASRAAWPCWRSRRSRPARASTSIARIWVSAVRRLRSWRSRRAATE